MVSDLETAFRRLIHLALLKLEFFDAGPAGRARGRPLLDLSRWDLSAEALTTESATSREEGTDGSSRAPSKREVIQQLKRDELQHVADAYELTVNDRRVNEQLVDAVVRSKKVRVVEILLRLSRERLKEICLGLELDDTGREKAVLVERICGDDNSADGDDEPPEAASTVTTLLTSLLGEALQVDTIGTGWPLRGTLVLSDKRFNVDIYARVVGGGSRGNALERRFQNPSQKSPIIDEPDRYELLFGVWTEQGNERAVIVAFEAFRRVDRATRFSLFMPLSLLEQAADTGFSTHENTRGETVYAFRPDNVGRYFQAFLQSESWRLQQSTAKVTPKREADIKASATIAPVKTDSIYIRPKVGMYAAFARLNYRPWFALAEFVDNSIQSFLGNRERLVAAGHDGPLVIDVNIDDGEISVTDRAGGIAWQDFPRAFSPAFPPDDATGLSEFGLGMKAAACWFSRRWTVRTSALAEEVERTVTFDIPKISIEGVENLPIEIAPSRESDHFTVVTMNDLRIHPTGKTLNKIRSHLASIYRVLLADGTIKIRLTVSGKAAELEYTPPALLEAPHFSTPNAAPIVWRQEFKVQVNGKTATGWAAILKSRSHSQSGFSVFRRRRLIEGSIGETYKPYRIFGSPSSPASLRITGEIFVEGLDVTHTKDGIQWQGHDEDELISAIASQLNTPLMPLLDQADNYRERTRAESLPLDFGADALEATAATLTQPAFPPIEVASALTIDSENWPRPSVPAQHVLQRRDFRVNIVRDGQPWEVHLKLMRDPAAPFYSTSVVTREGIEIVTVDINLDHQFSIKFINDAEALVAPLVNFIAALALGEHLSRTSGIKQASSVRFNANEILRSMLLER